MRPGPKPIPPEERFWAKVDLNGPIPDQDDPLVRVSTPCWLWTVGTDQDGYALLAVDRYPARAFRWAYERWVAPIPEGLQLDHLCRVPRCVRFLDHGEPVTPRENTIRGRSAVVIRTGRCQRDHDDWVVRGGERRCRTCDLEAQRRRRLAARRRRRQMDPVKAARKDAGLCARGHDDWVPISGGGRRCQTCRLAWLAGRERVAS